MAPQGVERKLTAILSADVKGYSRLMGEDEVATVRTLTAYREVMVSLIQQHRGRVVDAPGDNLLAEFASVVDAVQCAVQIQQALKARNAELPEHRQMHFRMGINLGDVVVDGERIYGDGVNIAARVEGLAEGGGICVSGTAYDQVRNKLALGYESLGEHTVKNITEPVRVYRVLMAPEAAGTVVEKRPSIASMILGDMRVRPWRWAALAVVVLLVVGAGAGAIWSVYLRPGEVASEEKMAFPLPDEPSIAVLPFENLSGDPEQEYFSDAIADGIITTLSKISNLFVVARNSTFTYKGKAVKVQQVAEELGVRYVLEGSVQKVSDRVRITAQLVDALTGNHLWAERYDRDVRGLFALQDEITGKIVTGLQVELTEGEQARLWAKGTESLEAWSYFVEGRNKYYTRFTKEANARARETFEKAIEADPEYALPYAWLGWTHWMDARQRWSESPAQSLKRAAELAQEAIALDDSLSYAHSLLGGIHLFRQQHDQAIAELEKAVSLSPNVADLIATLGFVLLYSGRPQEAIALVKKAMRLSPNYEPWYLAALAHAYRLAGQHEEAVAAYKEYHKRKEGARLTRALLATVYLELGRDEEAQAEIASALSVDPKFSLDRAAKILKLYKNPEDLERTLDAMRKAGLPE